MTPTMNRDVLERTKERVEDYSRRRTGVSAIHALTLVSIGASVALYLSGRKDLAIFLGLWAPTLQSLRYRD